MTEITCNSCGWSGPEYDCRPSASVYHDLCCPWCGSVDLDTSQMRKAWEARGDKYGYGDNNTLKIVE